MARRYRIFLVLSLLSLVADQASKAWARSALVETSRVPVIPGYFDWVLHYNTRIAFSLPISGRWFLAALALAMSAGIVFYYLRRAEDDRPWYVTGLSLVVGGAIGNAIDRLVFGKVTDFALLHYHEHAWPVFNVADVALVVGVGLLLVTGGPRPRRVDSD